MKTAIIISLIIMGICCTFIYSSGALSKKPDVKYLVAIHGDQTEAKKGSMSKAPLIVYYDDNVQVKESGSYLCIEGKARRIYVDKGMVEISKEGK